MNIDWSKLASSRGSSGETVVAEAEPDDGLTGSERALGIKVDAGGQKRWPDGQLAAGTRGGPGRLPRVPRSNIREHIPASAVKGIVEQLIASAKAGDVPASRLVLDYVHPRPKLSTETVELPEHIAMLAPHERVLHVSRLVSLGEVPLEHGAELMRMAAVEINVAFVAPLKAVLLRLRAGEKVSHQTLDGLLGVVGGMETDREAS